jgi:hypothetical protein
VHVEYKEIFESYFLAGFNDGSYAQNDTIDLASIPYAASDTVSYNPVSGFAVISAGGSTYTLDIAPGSNMGTPTLASDGNGGIDFTMPCFRAGTLVQTPRGKIAVEALAEGDTVLAWEPDGGVSAQPIVWIGHRAINCQSHPRPAVVWPVRIRAGAFGENQPCRDLYLSPDHAVFVDGGLIPVKLLIDGDAIVQCPTRAVTYYHLELPRHALLRSEGLLTESFLDTGCRANFANGGAQVALFPDFSARLWEVEGCAPLIVTGPKLAAARARLTRPEAPAIAQGM